MVMREQYKLMIQQTKLVARDMRSSRNIVFLANGEHKHSSLNEEYENIAKKYVNKEISFEEFREGYQLLEMAMKLIDE